MALFFTADTHFGHRNLTQAGKFPAKARPFATVEEHDDHLVRQWNRVVGPSDTVFHLGDIAWGRKVTKYDILSRLNGKIHLIRGNHDQDFPEHMARASSTLGVRSVHDLLTIKHQGRKIVLCHYPLASWDSGSHGSIHLHGHSHGKLPADGLNRQDVGVDVWDWAPVSIDTLFSLFFRFSPSQTRER